jgi:hypothetical protein
MRLGNQFMTAATNILFGTNLQDVETCYKVLHRQVVDRLRLQSKGFELETEITAQIIRLGYDIAQVPISYQPRYGEEKKLTPWDGIPTLWQLIRHRFNRLPLDNMRPEIASECEPCPPDVNCPPRDQMEAAQ